MRLTWWLLPWAQRLLALYPELQVTSTYRSRYQQALLYQTYLHGGSRYPAAPPGRSYHEYGRAFDVAGPQELLEEAGAIWESWGGTWGGRFGDPIHFQA